MSRSQAGLFAAGVLVLGLWLPWAQVTLLGVNGPTVNGQEIGTDILSWPVGYITAGAGVLGAIGLLGKNYVPTLVAGAVALAVTGYTLLAVPGTETNSSANGIDLGQAIQVKLAWGLFVVVAASIGLLVSGIFQLHEETAEAASESKPDLFL
jgi:hypothetical protein